MLDDGGPDIDTFVTTAWKRYGSFLAAGRFTRRSGEGRSSRTGRRTASARPSGWRQRRRPKDSTPRCARASRRLGVVPIQVVHQAHDFLLCLLNLRCWRRPLRAGVLGERGRWSESPESVWPDRPDNLTRGVHSPPAIPPWRDPLKRAIFVSQVLLASLVVTGDIPVVAAYCTPLGSGTCTACKNCRHCHHCSEQGGKCSVCR